MIISYFHLIIISLFCLLSGGLIVDSEDDETVDGPKFKFGHELLRNKEFLLNYTNFNHGSFGACPKFILEYQSNLRLQQEQQPDPWMRYRYLQMLNETRRKVAEYINADTDENVVLLESASTAVNSVLRSFNWENQSKIAYFTTAYNMVKNTAGFLAEYENIDVVTIPVSTFPITEDIGDDAFLLPLRQMLENLRKHDELHQLRVVVLDHILSCPGIKTPLETLAAMVKNYSPETFVLVDGAHALGQFPNLNLQSIGKNFDAYLSNGHKWFYTPKGSAFLWIKQTQITKLFPEPTVISSANSISPSDESPSITLSRRFGYTSTRDYTALLSFDAAFDFRKKILGGDAALYEYVRNLALNARRYLINLWNVTAIAPEYMEEFMINIVLPINNPSMGMKLQDFLLKQHEMYVVVVHDKASGLIYTRLSAQVYLEISDFKQLGRAVLDFLNLNRNHVHGSGNVHLGVSRVDENLEESTKV